MLSENDKLSKICYCVVNFLSSHCVFLNRGENGSRQFNSSGLFLIRPQTAFMFFSLYFMDFFQHTSFFFELRSAAHIDTFELPCVKTVWIEVEGHCKCALMIVVERGETITSLLSPPRFFFKMVPGIETPQPWKGSHQWHQSINSCLLHCCHAIACCKFSC